MIYLIRHGQTDWNIEHRIQGQKDIPLNETGRTEALVCAQKLADIRIDRVISSDLSRARETAQIINKQLSAPFSVDPRLREIDFGDLQGVLAKDITGETWDIFNHKPDQFHAESLDDVYHRLKSFFAEIDAKQNTLIVSHGGAIRLAVYYTHNPHSFNQQEFEKNFLQFKIKNTEIFMWDKIKPIQFLSGKTSVYDDLEF